MATPPAGRGRHAAPRRPDPSLGKLPWDPGASRAEDKAAMNASAPLWANPTPGFIPRRPGVTVRRTPGPARPARPALRPSGPQQGRPPSFSASVTVGGSPRVDRLSASPLSVSHLSVRPSHSSRSLGRAGLTGPRPPPVVRVPRCSPATPVVAPFPWGSLQPRAPRLVSDSGQHPRVIFHARLPR